MNDSGSRAPRNALIIGCQPMDNGPSGPLPASNQYNADCLDKKLSSSSNARSRSREPGT
jgi:hypothetical protein